MRLGLVVSSLMALLYWAPRNTRAAECDETETVERYNSWLACLQSPPPCLGLGSYACVCSQCRFSFQSFIISYLDYTSRPTCQFSDPALVYNVISILSQLNCFIRPSDCANYASNPFCTQMPFLRDNNFPTAGNNAANLCLDAIADSCSILPTQPICTGSGYVVDGQSPDTYIRGGLMTVYELMCAETSRFALDMNTGTNYAVNMRALNSASQDQTLNTVYYAPPVILAPENCDSNAPRLEMDGTLMRCIEGMQCDYVANSIRRVVYCPGGHTCTPTSDPEGTEGTQPVPCASGTYCPLASTEPRQCGFLEICGDKSIRPIKLIGAFSLGIALAALLVLYAVVYSVEKGMREYKRGKAAEPAVKSAAPINIKFDHLSAHLTRGTGLFRRANFLNPAAKLERRCILGAASGEFRSGRLTAVMGPSGSGKTTLLNCVLGKVTPSSGTVYVNGVQESLAKYGPVFGVVPQSDTMLAMLTVEDVLLHSARTRLPRGTSDATAKKYVDYTLGILGLSHIRHSVIGDEKKRGVSGGEKKRVNIGIELVANPSFLIADEPTTGLDAAAALECAQVLQKIARTQRTVVCIVHQPRFEIFDMFDDLLLLDGTGSTVYYGPVSKAVDHFQRLGFTCPPTFSPPDFLLDLVSKKIKNKDGLDIGAMKAQGNTDNARDFGHVESGHADRDLFDDESRGYKDLYASHQRPHAEDVLANFERQVLQAQLQSSGHPRGPRDPHDELGQVHSASFASVQSSTLDGVAQGPAFLSEPLLADTDGSHGQHGDRMDEDIINRYNADRRYKLQGHDSTPNDPQNAHRSDQHAEHAEHGSDKARSVAPMLKQIQLNLARNLLQHYRIVVNMLVFIVVHMVAALCVGAGFIGNGISYLFLPPLPATVSKYCPYAIKELCETEPLLSYALLNAFFFTSLSASACAIAQSVYTFGDELAVMHREAQTGVKLLPYFLGKNLADLPFIFMGALTFTGIFIPMLQPYQSIFSFFIVVLLIELVTFGLGYAISAYVKRQYTAPVIGVVFIFASCVCSGLEPSLKMVHQNFSVARLLWDFSFVRYANEALYVIEMDIFVKGSEAVSQATTTHLNSIGYYKKNYFLDLGALVGFAIFFRVLAYFLLRRRISHSE